MTNNSYIQGAIKALLVALDNEDWDSFAKLLDNDAVYEVSGYPRFEGKRAIMDYYENIRPIKSGTHIIESIFTDADKAVCCGKFSGLKKDGERIDLFFADEISFENFKIKQRRVYFCQPAD